MSKSFTVANTILTRVAPVRDGRTITNDKLYVAYGKDPNISKDRDYIATQVSVLKEHGLVDIYHTQNVWPKRRTHVILTDKAMDILEGKTVADGNKGGETHKAVSLQEIADLAKEWNRQNPSFRIDPTPKFVDEELTMAQG